MSAKVCFAIDHKYKFDRISTGNNHTLQAHAPPPGGTRHNIFGESVDTNSAPVLGSRAKPFGLMKPVAQEQLGASACHFTPRCNSKSSHHVKKHMHVRWHRHWQTCANGRIDWNASSFIFGLSEESTVAFEHYIPIYLRIRTRIHQKKTGDTHFNNHRENNPSHENNPPREKMINRVHNNIPR
jgi:hypothetical protein